MFIDEKFRDNKVKYIGQSILAGLAVAVALVMFDIVNNPVIIASFGASGFIAFTAPHHRMARPRHMIGAYMIGILVGGVLHYITFLPIEHYLTLRVLYTVTGGLAVGITMFLMAITNTEHAPGTSVALGLVINDWSWYTIVFILIGIMLISLIQRKLKNWMIGLG